LLAASLSPNQGGAGTAAPTQKIVRPVGGNLASDTAVSVPGMDCSGGMVAPAGMTLAIGKSTLLRLPEPVLNRTLGNPGVAQAMLVSPQNLYLLGVQVGTTNMILQGKSGICSVIDIQVTMDPAALQASYKALMPEETGISVTAAADSLVLSGSVTDAVAIVRAVELATAFVRRPAVMSAGAQQEGMASSGSGSGQNVSGSANLAQQQMRIINLLGVNAAQQVMLEVKIAEVSKSLLDKLGANVTGRANSGIWASSIVSNFLTATAGGVVSLTRANGSGVTIDAEKKDGLIKILAEPTVMAISGQEGSFLVGGKILIPVSQDATGGSNRITLEEKEFGVGLKFTPTVLSGGRINLRVAPEVSELSREGVGVSASGNNNRAILPLITTRRASTTVQLADGQSFVIGGLIKNNTTANITAFPILGEIPVIGALFRSTDFQQDRTELLFVVTPRLVKPQATIPKLPTDGLKNPSRSELFLGGRLEGSKTDADKQDDGAGGFALK